MTIPLKDRLTGYYDSGQFTPITTVNVDGLHLILFCQDITTTISKKGLPDVETDAYNQVCITKIHHIMYGKLLFQEKEYEVQMACILSSKKFEPIMIYHYPHKPSLLSCGFKEYTDVCVIDYKDYSNTVRLMGNNADSFKHYVLKRIFSGYMNPWIESELDEEPQNETSFFDLNHNRNNMEEDDFITIKGMKVYFEEVANGFYNAKS